MTEAVSPNSIREELLGLIKKVGLQFQQFPWEDRESYIRWVSQTYYFVRHTTIFISLMAAEWGIKNRDLQYDMLHILKEESGHDLLLLNDLKHLGASIEEQKEFPETKVFYQNQYYSIQNISPAAQLGYGFFLEGIAATQGKNAYARIARAHGETAGTFLKTHGEEDGDHLGQHLKLLDKLNSQELTAFIESAHQSAILYSMILERAKKS